MTDKLDNLKETIDDIGYGIYMAEVIAWDRLTKKIGVATNLATAVDVLSILVGAYIVLTQTNALQVIGGLVLVAGIAGMLRRAVA